MTSPDVFSAVSMTTAITSSQLDDKGMLMEMFKLNDLDGCGLIGRCTLSHLLEEVGCDNVSQILDEWFMAAQCGNAGFDSIVYADFIDWLLNDASETSPGLKSLTGNALQVHEISEGLSQIASTLAADFSSASAEILHHVAALRRITQSWQSYEASERPTSAGSSASPARSTVMMSPSNIISLRDQAALVVEQTGLAGELVDDLQEVSINDLKTKAAMSCWRSCHGLRLYRSDTVTKALRLICSAPVPGLNGTTYLEVFEKLTKSGWEHYMFLFGGVVRDILRRKVGNDIDITFSAPAEELAELCERHGYQCHLEGDYILIGNEAGVEYLEGMVITHNGVTPPENSDFSMNWVFYDFCNDVIIDKTGRAVPAVMANKCEIPCPRQKWDTWVKIGGPRVLFRYYKFLARGYEYTTHEMSYIADRLLRFWESDAAETVAAGREVLHGLYATASEEKIEKLRQVVFASFDAAAATRAQSRHIRRQGSHPLSCSQEEQNVSVFLSASAWWQKGWSQLQS